MSDPSPAGATSPPRPRKRARKGTFRVAKDPSAKPVIATTVQLNQSGSSGSRLRVKRANAAVTIPPVDPSTPQAVSNTPQITGLNNQNINSAISTVVEHEDQAGPAIKRKRKYKYTTTSSRLTEWVKYRDTCIDELLRMKGKGDQYGSDICSICSNNDCTLYRCLECAGRCLLYCEGCVLATHKFLPLHRIEKWNGKFFEKQSLIDLGLCIHLGHGAEPCPTPSESTKLVLLDISGLHELNVKYCECHQYGFTHRRNQLLRFGWFPATYDRPRTAFTFTVLDFFHELTLQGKANIFDFYHTLCRISDNLQLQKSSFLYKDFHHTFRVWRHLQQLKWSGRGHDPEGSSLTKKGDTVLECPACPHPGINLPENWRDAPEDLRYLYTLFIAVDANFKLKNKARGINDVELAPGWAHFVENEQYQEHISNYLDQPEINTCSSEHNAVVRANVSLPGYSINGVGLAICARHSMVRPNGAGDLAKGEKYCSMDYIILSALQQTGGIQRVLVSYDIACQWSKNLRKRMLEYADHLQLPEEMEIDVGIPSWHVNGHGEWCRSHLSLSYIPGVGRTCGEDIETTWSSTNPLVPSTREMGPAARRETLNDHWGGWNFRKIVTFRPLFLKRFKVASHMKAKHNEIFDQLSKTFEPKYISQWETMVRDWQNDRTKPNPYEEAINTATIHDVRLELAKEDARDAESGQSSVHNVTPTEFLTKALELEEHQRILHNEVAQFKGKKTNKHHADLQQKRTALYRRIQNWREIQMAYIPSVATLLVQIPNTEIETPNPQVAAPEKIRLHLPSDLPPSMLNTPQVKPLADKERRLRIAQADQALAEIRRGRRIISGYSQFRKLNVAGTGNKPNTRMRSLYNRMQSRIDHAASRYRAAYKAVLQLDALLGVSESTSHFRELQDADIRGPGKEDDDNKLLYTSNRAYVPSWIWLIPRLAGATDNPESTDDVTDQSMRTEWTKAKARRDRWDEEFLLVQEEMRRVVVYLIWKADWWREQGDRRQVNDPSLAQGLSAYAEFQASNWEHLAESCASKWTPALLKAGLPVDWASRFPDVLTQAQKAVDKESAAAILAASSTNPNKAPANNTPADNTPADDTSDADDHNSISDDLGFTDEDPDDAILDDDIDDAMDFDTFDFEL